MEIEVPIKFVIYTDQNNKWRVQVNFNLSLFIYLLSVHELWPKKNNRHPSSN